MTSAHDDVEKNLQFSELDISSELKQGIKDLGYTAPTHFQISIFKSAQSGKDVVGDGRSHYGKSLAFALPILAKIRPDNDELQALVISENAMQADLFAKECKALGRHLNINVAIGMDAFLSAKDKNPAILVVSCEELLKTDLEVTASAATVFIDNLSLEHGKQIGKSFSNLSKNGHQFLIFGKETAVAFYSDEAMNEAVFISNNDQPKIAVPAKHIIHLQKEAEPKPRALLAALELHKPKLALITCNESAECELLSRYLSRYGYRIRCISEEANARGFNDALKDGLAGNLDIILCQNTLVEGSLERVSFMINYDMFERPKSYEQTTQFAKQADGVQRTIVNILSSREVGYLSPIKAQCLIDFSELPLPSEDEVMALSAERILDCLNREASDVELSQFEALAQKILEHANARQSIAFLLRNHFAAKNAPKPRAEPSDYREKRDQRHTRSFDRDRPRHDRGGDRFERNDRREPQKTHPPRENNYAPHKTEEPAEQENNQDTSSNDGITRLYVTLGKRDGFLDLASLAQYLSDKSGVDLGHFSLMGMVRDHSAHIEVDDDVASDIIKTIHNSPRPGSSNDNSEQPNLVVCEKARASSAPRPFRRPQQRRRPNFQRRG